MSTKTALVRREARRKSRVTRARHRKKKPRLALKEGVVRPRGLPALSTEEEEGGEVGGV